MMDNGLIITSMDSGHTQVWVEPPIQGSGRMTNKMDWEKRHGQTGLNLKEIIKMEKNMDLGYIIGIREVNMKVNSFLTK